MVIFSLWVVEVRAGVVVVFECFRADNEVQKFSLCLCAADLV